jgi:hypothetical protein
MEVNQDPIAQERAVLSALLNEAPAGGVTPAFNIAGRGHSASEAMREQIWE